MPTFTVSSNHVTMKLNTLIGAESICVIDIMIAFVKFMQESSLLNLSLAILLFRESTLYL